MCRGQRVGRGGLITVQQKRQCRDSPGGKGGGGRGEGGFGGFGLYAVAPGGSGGGGRGGGLGGGLGGGAGGLGGSGGAVGGDGLGGGGLHSGVSNEYVSVTLSRRPVPVTYDLPLNVVVWFGVAVVRNVPENGSAVVGVVRYENPQYTCGCCVGTNGCRKPWRFASNVHSLGG